MKNMTNKFALAFLMLIPSSLVFGNLASDRVEYIHPQVQTDSLFSTSVQSMQSDEYWEEVSGKQLQLGVTLYAGADALVRLAPMVSNQSGARNISEDLDMSFISLSGDNKQVQMAPLAAQEDMELAGFRDGSVALTVNNQSRKPFVLKTAQSLLPEARYLVHVKEKNSPFKLSVAADKSLSDSRSGLIVTAEINGNKMLPFTTKAKLIAPDGSVHNALYRGDEVRFDSELVNVGAINGFYEMQLTGVINVDNQLVKRSVKVPFIKKQQTASLVKQAVKIAKNRMFVDVSVHEAGRYNIKATLRGKDASGNWQLLQTAEVAQWLNGDQSLMLPFELSKFEAYRELSIVNIFLVDQTRLIALESVPTLNAL